MATRREPTREEIFNKISDVIGFGPEEFLSYSKLEDSLSEEELREFRQRSGLGRAATAKERKERTGTEAQTVRE